ncbi:MAG: hypothetical protein GY828_04190, partial [Candidatus Gracilibacteria bacterium]|nr:hypothetical protein [Candidatus Gracilibacteria bacterium]
MISAKIKDFLRGNRKITYYIGLFLISFFLFGDVAFANTGDGKGPLLPESEIQPGTWFNAFIQIITTLVGVMSNIVGVFLNPSWTNGIGLGLHEHLRSLWILISNVVYFIFAFLLVVIAFMNIIGKGDKWELKQALPKFIVGVLIVPFSWFFVQFVLSISSFLSASVLLVPYDTFSTNAQLKGLLNQKVCTTFVIANKSKPKGNSEGYKQGCAVDVEKSDDKEHMKTIGEILSSDSAYGLLGVYTYGIFSIDEVTTLKGEGTKTFTDIFKLGINTIVILVLFVVYLILLISLTLALFVRGVWLWLYTIFSPVFGLLYFFGKEKEGFIDGKFSITEFIGLAMVPVYVSAALAFGLLFTFVAGLSFSVPEGEGDMLFTATEQEANYSNPPVADTTGTGTRIRFLNDFKIDMYGEFGTSSRTTLKGFDVLKTSIGTLIMQLFGIAV